MGRIVLIFAIGFFAVILGMLLYPTVHFNWIGIDVTGWLPITKAGAVIVSYAFLFFIVYAIYKLVKK